MSKAPMEQAPMERFDDALRAWAERPPRTPAASAARQVADRLEKRRPVFSLWPRLAAALVALALAVGLYLADGSTRPGTHGAVAGELGGALDEPLDGGVVLIWIDDQTPLYMTLEPPSAEKGISQ